MFEETTKWSENFEHINHAWRDVLVLETFCDKFMIKPVKYEFSVVHN